MELEEILRKKECLKNKILEFPAKVEYPCMIPLSKIAFSPGKLIHTNEFYVPNPLGEKKLMSYLETASVVENSIKALKSKVVDLEQASSPQKNPSSHAEIRDIKIRAPSPPPLPMEIRELYDESGQLINTEVVNLSEEFKRNELLDETNGSKDRLESLYEDLKQRINLTPATRSDEAILMDEDETLRRELAAIHLARTVQSLGPHADPEDLHLDEGLQTQIAEYRDKCREGDRESVADMMSRLEEAEERERREEQRAALERRKKEEGQFLSSNTWKKGFLSASQGKGEGGAKKTKKAPVKARAREGEGRAAEEASARGQREGEGEGHTAAEERKQVSLPVPVRDSLPSASHPTIPPPEVEPAHRPVSRFKASRISSGSAGGEASQEGAVMAPSSFPLPPPSLSAAPQVKKAFSGKIVEK